MATEFKNIPDTWASLLRIVGTHWLPMVAGGCLRDAYLDLPAKDVDIFVPAHSDEDFYSIIDSLPSALVEGEIIWIGTAYIETERSHKFTGANPGAYGKDEAAPDLVGVWEGEICGVPVNIIARESLCEHFAGEPFGSRALRLLDTFDFDILQNAYGAGQGEYFRTPESRAAVRNKVATLRHDRSYQQSLARFAKFNQRNPGVLALNDPFKGEL